MLSKATLLIGILILVLLSGCWIPEQFDAKVTVNRDGSYIFAYDGTLIFASALAASRKGELSAKGEAAFKQEAVKLAHEPGFKKTDYLGSGRCEVSVEKIGKAGEPYYFPSEEFNVFAVLPQQDGTVSISAIGPDQKVIQKLNSIAARIDGTLTISVASGAKVLKHNAQSQPYVFGLFGGYKWKIKSPDDTPFMVIQPIL